MEGGAESELSLGSELFQKSFIWAPLCAAHLRVVQKKICLLGEMCILWASVLQAARLEALEEYCKRTELSNLIIQGFPKSLISFL